MAKSITVHVGGKTYNLKFGYGVLRRLSEALGFDSFDDLGKHIDSLKLADGALSFSALNFVGLLISSAISYGSNEDIDPDVVVDEVIFENPDLVTEIVVAFFDSFPKGNDQGKPKPATKRRNPKPKK